MAGKVVPYVDNYDVFVSFRGADTRSGFVSHLYRSLKDAGIHAFLDNEELSYGKRLADELPQAIRNSRIYIPVLSENYASSRWCLRELAEIVKNKHELDQDKEILPVFYKVTTDDVKLKTDVFKKHLKNHMGKESNQTVEEWIKALQSIPERRGWSVPSNSSIGDAEFCEEIVKRVSVMLKVKHKQVPEGLIGMDNPVKELMKLLDVASHDLQVIGIYGMGGIGKTTLAKVVYNKLCNSYDCCSFLSNVRESLLYGDRECLVLQQKLLKDVSHKGRVSDIRDTDEAISTIKRRLEGRTVLLVLDDVSEPNQLEILIGNSYRSFGWGSCIIITTRNVRNVQLKGEGEKVKIYEMEEMTNEDALQLFSWHAFGKLSPPEDYRSLCDDIVCNLSEGLPLSLEVIGSLLYRKTKEAWRSTIQKLWLIPHKDIQKKLMVSYEDLSDEAKEIFLDIACFFVDEERTYEIHMWEACKLFPQLSIEELVSMCLVKVKEDKYWMHDHIKGLGREIVRREGLEDQACRSRFWIKEDSLNILTRRQKEYNNIKAIRVLDLDTADVKEMWIKSFTNLDKLRFLQMDVVQKPNLPWMENVKFEVSFPNLRWLSWYYASLEQLKVTRFSLNKLVILDFSYSEIDEDWPGWEDIKGLHSLQVLDLTGCQYLFYTPDFSQFTSLKRLILRLCTRLREIDPSIISLKALEYLDFTGCCSLQSIPEEIFSLVHLEEILGDANHTTLVRIPESVGVLASLVTLRLHQSVMDALPDVIGRLINLQSLDLSWNNKLKSLPESIGGMLKLENLLLERCTGLVSLPDSLTSLAKLQRLILSGCYKLQSLPDSVGEMVSLKEVDISYTALKKLPCFIAMQKKLEKLDAKWTKVEGIPTEIEGLRNVRVLNMRDTSICELPSLVQLSRLEELNLESCNRLKQLPELPTSLVKLSISSASLQSVPDLSCITNLTQLKLVVPTTKSDGSAYVDPMNNEGFNVGKFFKLKKLQLSCSQNFTITTPSEFANLSQLEQLDLQCSGSETCVIMDLPRLKEIYMSLYKGTTLLSLARLDFLVHFHISECEDLAQIRGLGEVVSLESLIISCCNSLERLDDLSKLSLLKYLEIKDCKKLRVILGVPDMQSLKKLQILGCESLQRLGSGTSCEGQNESSSSSLNLPKLKVLRVARIENCRILSDIQCLKGLESVQINNCSLLEGGEFDLSEPTSPMLREAPLLQDLESSEDWTVERCRLPKELSDLSMFQSLKRIRIIRCETLSEITGLGELPFLTYLRIKHCNSIQRLYIDDIKSLINLYIGYCRNLNDIGSFPYNVLCLNSLCIHNCALLETKLSIKAERMVKGMMVNGMMLQGLYECDYETDDDDDDGDV